MRRVLSGEVVVIGVESDLIVVRQVVRERAAALGLSALARTRVITAASELGRNTLVHGRGGAMRLESVAEGERHGIRLIFEDKGPGIEDVALAMTDGFTTNRGMGLGLSGSKRLMDEFDVISEPGGGTRVTATLWA